MQKSLQLLFLLGVSVFLAINAIAQAPTAGLVAYYPFNGNANDETGNGHAGSVFGAGLTTDRFGNVSKAFSFDGVDDVIVVANQADLNSLDFTYSLWANINEYGTSTLDDNRIASMLMAKYDNSKGFVIFNNEPGQLVLRPTPSTALPASNDFFTNQPIPLNSWKQVVFTKSGQQIRVYVDGTLSSAGVYEGNYTTSASHLMIGSGPWQFDEFFKGKLDDIRIYNRALSESEVAQLYTSEATQANCVSVKSGFWNDPSVWSCNRIPLISDLVQLKHVVTIPTEYQALAMRVTFDDSQRLVFGTGSTIRLGISSIQGVWTGTYTYNGNPELGAQYFSFEIKPDGTLIVNSENLGQRYTATGTWVLNGNAFSGSYTYVNGSSPGFGTSQTVTATWDNATGKLTSGVWANTSPDNGYTGTFSLTKVN
ncbi:hypothetical protein GCM10027592_44570 [Spirosoma flavus]